MATPDLKAENRHGSRLAPGDVLAGKYRVERLVGEGGMGQVLAATHLGLGQEVAIKIMLSEKASESDSVERFLREARAAVMLKSSHVARVFDVATTDGGLPYIVMELLDGKDLVTVLLESGALAYADAVDVIVQACDAVAEAHALGIIHRDLKPENFFLSLRRDGSPHVKVLDFGISKLGIESATHKGGRLVTQENTVLGSPTYMSPEQVKNSKRVDERSDIWSLGVSLYELLTAAEPFGADTIPEIFVNVLTATPLAPDQVIEDIPPELSAIVMRCLEKEPAARFQNVSDLASALSRFGTGRPVSIAPRWSEGEKAPDSSSSSLVRRLSAPTPPPFKPMVITSGTARLDAVTSSPAPMSVSKTIAETRPAKSRRALVVSVSLTAAALLLLAGGATERWKLRRSHDARSAASAAAAPSGEGGSAAPPEPAPSAEEPPPVALASSAEVASPRASVAPAPPAAPAAGVRGGRPARGAVAPRPAAASVTATPKASGLPRERTSW